MVPIALRSRWSCLPLGVVLTAAVAAAADRPIVLEVDAREAPRRIFHTHMTMPVAAGPLTLVYPKWIPGEHGPTGPVADVAGLKITAAGQPIVWHRDPVEMYELQLDVPVGIDTLDVSFDYLSPADGGAFTSGASATAQLAVISWSQLLLFPKSARADDLLVTAVLRLPAGWKYGTAIRSVSDTADRIAFEPVSLTTLIDSPVLAGTHFRTIQLTTEPVEHRLCLAADSDAALEIKPQLTTSYKHLIAEANALFGAHHYRAYTFLLTLSDHTAHFGLEHHECSDDRTIERALIDDDGRRILAGLLPHEMAHSWNGKYRRPADLAIGSFNTPMQGQLLWVYEGLTQYLGQVLTARSGLLKPEDYRDSLALTASEMEEQGGRAWRPLVDTAVAAQLLYGARPDWSAWRRSVDFYEEGELLWLEADTVIRRETHGEKSLDTFCRDFFGGEDSPPQVVPYTFDDVMAALNAVVDYDWRTFWTTRLESTGTRAPLGGITASGWKLVYTKAMSPIQKAAEGEHKIIDERASIGITLHDDGTIPDVLPNSAADRSGIAPGMKLVAVNGRRWSRDILHEGIAHTRKQPLELLIENGEFFKTYRLDYNGGERYPHLERDNTLPDLLSQIITPRTWSLPSPKPTGSSNAGSR